MQRLLDFTPTVDFESGLLKTCEYYRTHPLTPSLEREEGRLRKNAPSSPPSHFKRRGTMNSNQ